MDDSSQKDSQTRQVVISEIKLIIFLATTVLAVAGPFFVLTKDVALIKQSIQTIQLNHEQHMQDALNEISESKAEIAASKAEIANLDKQLIRLNQYLDDHFRTGSNNP